MTINDLSDRTGVPRRTIRYYVEIGLLPRPSGSGRAAIYGQEHMSGLRLIRKLQGEGLTLDQIRDTLAPSAADVTSASRDRPYLRRESAQSPSTGAPSAAEYLADVRRRLGEDAEPSQQAWQPPRMPARPGAQADWHAEPWQRVRVDRDVELHVRRMSTKRLAHLVNGLRRLLADESERTT